VCECVSDRVIELLLTMLSLPPLQAMNREKEHVQVHMPVKHALCRGSSTPNAKTLNPYRQNPKPLKTKP